MGFFARRRLGLALGLVVLFFDQLSKLWALGALLSKNVLVLPWLLEFTLSFNRGVAFSFFADLPHSHLPYYLSGFAFIVSTIFIIYMPTGSRLFQAGLGCIVGGAVGNMIDRLIFGGVIDFIHVHYESWSFPVFNVADVGINIGVGLILLDAVWQMRQQRIETRKNKTHQTEREKKA